ncbi:MAG: alpha-L-rhamnosidase N-terminal domain-containing protein [Terracidiphilus sp.]
MNTWIWALVLSVATGPVFAQQAATTTGPVELRVDNLTNPLGIDDPTPKFSWQLRDPEPGAKQTAYEVMVASSPELLAHGKADVWDSGRVASEQSLNVRYGGPALKPSARYSWCVKLWGANGKTYAASETAWWETGLMSQDAWKAQWIGWETPEEATVRHAPADWIASPDAKSPAIAKDAEQRFAYRATIMLPQAVKFAALYATGQDTVAAWVNGAQALTEDPLPRYKHTPWKKFVRADVTAHLSAGKNTVAIEALHYVVNPNGMATDNAPPMIATLVVEYADGTWASFGSNTEWKTAIGATEGWQQKDFDDSGWKAALVWMPLSSRRSESLGHPWIPDSVKELRYTFTVEKPVRSARLYATALGAYQMFVNELPVSDQVLAPGWTDYRERVVYQIYDVTDQVVHGKNFMGAFLAPGWYETPLEWFQQPNNYGDTPPALRAQLRIEHGRSCGLSTRTAAWSGWRRMRAGRRGGYSFCTPRYTMANRRTRVRGFNRSRVKPATLRSLRRLHKSSIRRRWRLSRRTFRRSAWRRLSKRKPPPSPSRAFLSTTSDRIFPAWRA